MRAVAFPSPVASQPPDAVDQLLYSDRLLTAKEVARLLSISEKTVYSYVSKGLMPYYKIQSSVRFRAKDLSLWLRQHGYTPR
jgi:excisionase family DNA binding protein